MALDDAAINGVCSWCVVAPWQFDQRPRTAERMTTSGARIYAIGQRSPSEQWVLTLMRGTELIGHYTPDAARLLAFDLLQMAQVCEGRHASQVSA